MIKVSPSKYKQYGDSKGVNFHLITNSKYSDMFEIDSTNYKTASMHICDRTEDFDDIIRSAERPAHILVISPEVLFKSPNIDILGNDAKLLVIPSNSSSISIYDIEYALKIMENTDVMSQENWAYSFFNVAENSKQIHFIDPATNTKAIFEHLSDEYEWFEQLGFLNWGEQQFSPMGEISVLPLAHGSFSSSKRLNINGEITFFGTPLVNSGKPSFLKKDREYIYSQLEQIKTEPIIAYIENGTIQSIRYAEKTKCNKALKMLEALFKVDSRYRNIWEIGFGSNTNMEIIDGNKVINEVYGNRNGCVHWGLGLTPWTQYHIDIICPNTIITNETGKVLAGGEKYIHCDQSK